MNNTEGCNIGPIQESIPQEVTFSKDDLRYLRDQASKYWQETDSKVELPGADVAMTESEAIAMGWLHAAIDVLYRKRQTAGSHGTGLFHIKPKLVIPSSEAAATEE